MIDGVMTTGQAARVLRISVRKVSTLIDSGRLRGWRIPGGNHRRVLADDVARMAESLGLSSGPETPSGSQANKEG